MYKLKNQLRCKAQAKARKAKAKQEQEQLVQIPWHELGNSGPNAVQMKEIACVQQASGRPGQLTRQQKDKNAMTGKNGGCNTIGFMFRFAS